MSERTGSLEVAFELDDLVFDGRGLLPVVVQEIAGGAVLMVAWANREAIGRTLETKRAHFWSRSREELWQKGETSGHFLDVESVLADCDRDTLLYRAHPNGPTCHRGTRSCFESQPAALELGWLADIVRGRRAEGSPSSYTVRLLDESAGGGVERVAQKVGEEAVEVVIAALAHRAADKNQESADRQSVVSESADLLYHLLVLLEALGIEPHEVAEELRDRDKK